MTFRLFLDILILVNSIGIFIIFAMCTWMFLRLKSLNQDQTTLAQILHTVMNPEVEHNAVQGFVKNNDND